MLQPVYECLLLLPPAAMHLMRTHKSCICTEAALCLSKHLALTAESNSSLVDRVAAHSIQDARELIATAFQSLQNPRASLCVFSVVCKSAPADNYLLSSVDIVEQIFYQ